MMGSATRSATRRTWLGAASGWPLWQLPRWLVAFVLAVIAAAGAAIVAAAALTTIHVHDLEIFAVLLGCDVVTVELTRRSGEPAGLTKETQAVWELPMALLLPPLYGLMAPIVRIALTQWRVRRALAYRRIFTAAAYGLTYAAASVTFHALAPPLTGFFSAPTARVEVWALVALACGVLRSVLNKVLVMTAVKGSDPAASIRSSLFTREALFGDLAELSVGVLVAYVTTASPLMALLALPCVTLLQRSQRHYQLVSETRVDGRTGLLNAVTWQREAAVRVTRATRPRAWTGTVLPAPMPRSQLNTWLLRFREAPWARPAAQDNDSALLALLMVDIDHFDVVNNTCGHLAGNAVLAAVAGTFSEHLRESDLCGRYGGDEFAILLPGTSPTEATAIAHRLCLAVSQLTFPAISAETGVAEPRVTVSVGVAALEGAHVDLDELVAAADDAMYRAKKAGRNTVRMIAI
jgi:diguanylate cyclase (GGDEF)-like protein